MKMGLNWLGGEVNESEIKVVGQKFVNNGVITADTVDVTTNPNNSPVFGGTISAANQIIYRGMQANNFNVKLSSLLNTPHLWIIGTQHQETGLVVSDSATVANVDHITVETQDGKTGLVVNGDNIHFNSVELKGASGVSDPRIEVGEGKSVSVGTLLVSSDKAKLQINKYGKVAVDHIVVNDGQKVSMQPDNGTSELGHTVFEIGTVDLGENATFATSLYQGTPKPKIEYTGTPVFNMGKGATVDLSSTLKSDGIPDNASLTASTVTINVKDASKANVYVPAAANRSSDTVISVVGDGANNTGNAENDLKALGTIVKENTTDNTGVTGVKVKQEASDVYDGASGVVASDGTGGITVDNIQVNPNTSTHGVSQMTALGVQIWRNEINDMNKRLGELRDSAGAANGLWTRVYNGQSRFGDFGIKNKYTAFQFGYDRQVTDGVWLGGAFSYTDGDSDFDHGDGENSLYAFTAYGSWLSDNGLFIDVTGKIGRMKNSFDTWGESGTSSATYRTNTVSVSAEAGWRVYPLKNAFFVEPQVELMYGHVYDAGYTTSADVSVHQSSADTLIGRVGGAVGFKLPDNLGNVYLRGSVLHDWDGDASCTFSQGSDRRTIKESLSSTWYEYGLGVNLNTGKNWHAYGDVEASSGGDVKTDYRVNFGVRYAW